MTQRIDLTGKVFGRLTVEKFNGLNNEKQATWQCKCQCGNYIVTSGKCLRNGDTKSCGCYQRDRASEANRKEIGEAATHHVYLNMRKNAALRGIAFDLTKDQVLTIAWQNCFYCGLPPSNISKSKSRGNVLYNGIDRINNRLGYCIENCVPCCKHCNTMKNGITPEMVSKLYYALKERGYIAG